MSLALLKRGEVRGKILSKKLQRTYIPVIQKHVGSSLAEDHVLFSDRQLLASSKPSEESQDLEHLKTPMIFACFRLLVALAWNTMKQKRHFR